MQPTITLEEFIRRVKAHVAGTIALGTINQRKLLSGHYDNPEFIGQAMMDLDHTTTQLLTMLYRVIVPDKPATLTAPTIPPATKPAPAAPTTKK